MKYRWLHVTEDYEVLGTNDEELARHVSKNFGPVVDVMTGTWIESGAEIDKLSRSDYENEDGELATYPEEAPE